MKKVAIVQSNYIPWKGYFDLIASVDEFILFDDMQYTRRDWRNRNKIKTPNGLQWLTVPVKAKGKYFQPIRDTEIDGNDWVKAHWRSLVGNYRKAPYFKQLSNEIESLYNDTEYTHISQLNRAMIEWVCKYLEINTAITNSWDYELCEGKTERLAELSRQAGASEYVSGPAASYIEEPEFTKRGIKLSWFNYDGYEEYPQLYGDFEHGVTIFDLIFNCGPGSSNYMRYV